MRIGVSFAAGERPFFSIVAVNTRFGGPATRDILGLTLRGEEEAMQRIALTHPDTHSFSGVDHPNLDSDA
jgi:hypothetical protein